MKKFLSIISLLVICILPTVSNAMMIDTKTNNTIENNKNIIIENITYENTDNNKINNTIENKDIIENDKTNNTIENKDITENNTSNEKIEKDTTNNTTSSGTSNKKANSSSKKSNTNKSTSKSNIPDLTVEEFTDVVIKICENISNQKAVEFLKKTLLRFQ